MQNAIDLFRPSIVRVRALGDLYNYLQRHTSPAIDLTDILRSQIVMAVSSLDQYIHEITRIGMIESYNGSRPRTAAFHRFQVSMKGVITGVSALGHLWFEDEIRARQGYATFQDPDTISSAIRLFSTCRLWPSVAMKLGISVQDAKRNLRLIVERRNKIAHEADTDPTYPGARWPISYSDAEGAVNYIEKLCEAINSVI